MANILTAYSVNNAVSVIMQFLVKHSKTLAIKTRQLQEKGKEITAGTDRPKSFIHSTVPIHSTPITERDKKDLEADLLLFRTHQGSEINREMNWNLLYEKQRICAQSTEVAQKREEESVLQHPQTPSTFSPHCSPSRTLSFFKVKDDKG